MKKRVKSKNPVRKMAARGFRGYPIATVAFYGPDNKTASKVAVGIVMKESEEPSTLERWFSDTTDVRSDSKIGNAIMNFIKLYAVKSIVVSDGIIGCPHEEGKDYPDGEVCPHCPFWATHDRFTHENVH